VLFHKQKEELIGIFLNSIQIMKESTSAVYEFLHLVKEALDVIVSAELNQNCFTSFYCLLSYYKQYVNCLFGNERITKERLLKRRGLGLYLEYFDEQNQLNTLGLLHAQEFVINIKDYVAGHSKKKIFGLIALFLYYSELKANDTALSVVATSEIFAKNAEKNLKHLDDSDLSELEGEGVTLHHFLGFYQKKHSRHFLKSSAAKIINEICLKNDKIEWELSSYSVKLSVQYRQKVYYYFSASLICSIISLKKALEKHDFGSFKEIWIAKVVKGFEVDGCNEILVETLKKLIAKANLDSVKFSQVAVVSVLLNPDNIAR
jgi:hypothetical protein